MIRAVGRALAIFDAFDIDHTSLSLQEIGQRIKMPKTTAFRLVNTLEQAGFLIRMDNQQYCLSLKLARLGDADCQSSDLGNHHAEHDCRV
jgi:IclR family transcriptional regulator, KDG regulon repressor